MIGFNEIFNFNYFPLWNNLRFYLILTEIILLKKSRDNPFNHGSLMIKNMKILNGKSNIIFNRNNCN